MRRLLSMATALFLFLSLLLVGNVSLASAATTTAQHDRGRFDHIFYIMMENHSTNQIFGNTADAPYNHYTLLATIERLWGLGCLQNSCGFASSALMKKFF